MDFSFCVVRIKFNQNVVGYFNNIHGTIAALCMSCQVSPYCSLLCSKLCITDVYFALWQLTWHLPTLRKIARRDEVQRLSQLDFAMVYVISSALGTYSQVLEPRTKIVVYRGHGGRLPIGPTTSREITHSLHFFLFSLQCLTGTFFFVIR